MKISQPIPQSSRFESGSGDCTSASSPIPKVALGAVWGPKKFKAGKTASKRRNRKMAEKIDIHEYDSMLKAALNTLESNQLSEKNKELIRQFRFAFLNSCLP
ncbi:hypothetical protein KY339_01205 [Candidatus Woesearchaeota archaeon]|nr:hypothetical protein [Candidatus Woesearchaeota archaeon]